jgi:hypothetical protein
VVVRLIGGKATREISLRARPLGGRYGVYVAKLGARWLASVSPGTALVNVTVSGASASSAFELGAECVAQS